MGRHVQQVSANPVLYPCCREVHIYCLNARRNMKTILYKKNLDIDLEALVICSGAEMEEMQKWLIHARDWLYTLYSMVHEVKRGEGDYFIAPEDRIYPIYPHYLMENSTSFGAKKSEFEEIFVEMGYVDRFSKKTLVVLRNFLLKILTKIDGILLKMAIHTATSNFPNESKEEDDLIHLGVIASPKSSHFKMNGEHYEVVPPLHLIVRPGDKRKQRRAANKVVLTRAASSILDANIHEKFAIKRPYSPIDPRIQPIGIGELPPLPSLMHKPVKRKLTMEDILPPTAVEAWFDLNRIFDTTGDDEIELIRTFFDFFNGRPTRSEPSSSSSSSTGGSITSAVLPNNKITRLAEIQDTLPNWEEVFYASMTPVETEEDVGQPW